MFIWIKEQFSREYHVVCYKKTKTKTKKQKTKTKTSDQAENVY